MSRRPIRKKDIEFPERIQFNLLSDYVEGRLDHNRFLYRACVIQIDQVGGVLSEGTDQPPNPKNSIRARVITDALDTHTPEEDLTIFWPLFPFDTMPLKEGEHCYVIFEDQDTKEHGLWLTRIPEPNNVDSLNLTPGTLKYEQDPENDFSSISLQQAVQDTTDDPGTPEVSEDFSKEKVPPFTARVGDRIVQGSNNTAIILSRDRVDDTSSGLREQAGTIDLVAGRAGPDISFSEDKSRIFITMNSACDQNFDIQVGNDAGSKAHLVLKSDEIRVIGREGMKLVVEGGDMFISAENVHIGPDENGESAMLGDTFSQLWDKVMNLLINHNHSAPVPVGPSPQLATLSGQVGLKGNPNQVLSRKIKLKKNS